jgi:hypothetical protein
MFVRQSRSSARPLSFLRRVHACCLSTLGFASLIFLFLPALCCAANIAPPTGLPDADDWRVGYSAVRVAVASPAGVTEAIGAVQAAGGRVAVAVPPAQFPGEAVLLGWLPGATAPRVGALAGVLGVLGPHSPAAALDAAPANAGLAFWRAVTGGTIPGPAAVAPSRPLRADARRPPPVDGDAPGRGQEGLLGTSDQMTGTVVTALFLTESNGTLDPDLYSWTSADSASEVSGVLAALSWWSSKAPSHGQSVTFTLVTYGPHTSTCQTRYEPILHTSQEVSLWVNEIMSHLGYTSGSDITRVRNYDTALRTQYGTNWAYSIFAQYNPSPAADSYTDGVSAWAWLGGPYLQTLFRSYTTPVQNVTAHESGHIFGACDEYAGPCGCEVCTKNVLNANCETCNPATVSCLMKYNDLRLCDYTPGQVGWDPAVATVVVDTAVVSDPAPGNNDGGADPGETVYLAVTLRNIGNAPARNVTGTMSTTDPYATVLTNSSYFGDVLITSTGSTNYRVAISSSASVGHVVPLRLSLSGSGYSGVDTISLVVSPVRVLRVTPATVVDTGVVTLRIGGKHILPGAGMRIDHSLYGSRTASNVVVVNSDSLTGQVNVAGIPLSTWDVVVVNPGNQEGRLRNGLYVQPAGPAITSVAPTGAAVTDSIGFGLKGVHFNQPTAVWIELGGVKRYGNTLVMVGSDSIHCGLSLRGLSAGTYDVVEQNFDTQTARLPASFTVWPTPDLQAISPEVVGVGSTTALTLAGVNFAAGGTAWLSAKNKSPIYATNVQFVSASELRATFNLTSAPSGVRTVVVQNPGGGKDSLVNALQMVTPPTVTVRRPNGGEHLIPGSQSTVSWTAQSLGNGLDHILVLLSMDGGITYGTQIASAGPTDTSATWTVPTTTTDSARVRVVAYDVDNVSGADNSDANFTIGTIDAYTGGTIVPHAFRLGRPVPAPARGPVAWTLEIPHTGRVSAGVYDVRGVLVARLLDAHLAPAVYSVRWSGEDTAHRILPAGVYVLRVAAETWHDESRVLMLH